MKTKIIITVVIALAAFGSFASGSRLHDLATMIQECEVVNVDDPNVTREAGVYYAYQLCTENGVRVSKYIIVNKTKKSFERFVW